MSGRIKGKSSLSKPKHRQHRKRESYLFPENITETERQTQKKQQRRTRQNPVVM